MVPVSVTGNGLVFGVGEWNECRDGRLVAFAANDGAMLWEYGASGPHPRHIAALDEANATVYHGSNPFLAYNYISRTERWNGSGYYIGAKGIAIDDLGNVYTGWHSGVGGSSRLSSYTPSGVGRWVQEYSNPEGPSLLAFVSPATLFVEHEGKLQAWDSSNGLVVWEAEALDNVISDPNGNLFCNSTVASELVSLTAGGNERWRTAISNAPSISLDFIDSDGRLYAHGTNLLFALSASNGAVLWQFKTDAPIGSPAVLGVGGRIVVSDVDGGYYVLDTTNNYAPSSWPVARYGNRRHTGKANDVLSMPTSP